jgi:hypothetical protein
MVERNLILNVSGVRWRRAELLAALERCKETISLPAGGRLAALLWKS